MIEPWHRRAARIAMAHGPNWPTASSTFASTGSPRPESAIPRGSPSPSRSCSRMPCVTPTNRLPARTTWRCWPPGTARHRRRTLSGPSSPRACSSRTSPGCRRWSTSPPCAPPWSAPEETPAASIPWCRSTSSSTTPCRSTHSATRRRTDATSSASTSATANATCCCAGRSRPSTASVWCRPAWASSTRSTSSTWPASCRFVTSMAARWRCPTRWWARTRTPPWSTASAFSAGASAASRPRPACSASPCSCSPRWLSGCASTTRCPPAPPPPTWC